MMKLSFTAALVLFAVTSSLVFGLTIFQKVNIPTALALVGAAAGILLAKTFELE